VKLAILDDYQNVALAMADWSGVAKRCRIDVINRPLTVPDEAARVLAPYDIICMLRERTAGPRSLIERLPNLKLLAITGLQHRTLDMKAATEHGVLCATPGITVAPITARRSLTIGLMLALVRRIPQEDRRTREGRWQGSVVIQLHGRTLGIVGLGKIGSKVARVARALEMTSKITDAV